MEKNIKLSRISRLVSIILLIIGVVQLPYFYYQILRWVVSGSEFYTALLFYQTNNRKWAWILIISGILYNPIAPFFLNKGIWNAINVVTAILLIISLTKEMLDTNT